jgi:hypothetical protein
MAPALRQICQHLTVHRTVHGNRAADPTTSSGGQDMTVIGYLTEMP